MHAGHELYFTNAPYRRALSPCSRLSPGDNTERADPQLANLLDASLLK
jgi:hypothetical protein